MVNDKLKVLRPHATSSLPATFLKLQFGHHSYDVQYSVWYWLELTPCYVHRTVVLIGPHAMFYTSQGSVSVVRDTLSIMRDNSLS